MTELEEFEKHASKRGYNLSRDSQGKYYCHQDTHERWLGWQAARAPQSATMTAEPVSCPKDFASYGRKAEAFKDPEHNGEHDPWYVALPNGALLKLGYHADDSIDKEHAEFIAAAINTAMHRTAPQPARQGMGDGAPK